MNHRPTLKAVALAALVLSLGAAQAAPKADNKIPRAAEGAFGQAFNHIQDIYADDLAFLVFASDGSDRAYEFFAAWVVLPWDTAADMFVSFRRQGIRLGSMDLKIACIALVHDATLLTRNTSDFAQIPGLRVANWLD